MLLTLLGVGILGVLAYQSRPTQVWVPVTGGILAVLSLLGQFTFIPLILVWAIYSTAALLFTQTELRRRYLTQPALDFFRKVLPPMSSTEREALDAGDVSGLSTGCGV